MKRIIRKLFWIVTLICLIAVTSATIVVYYYQDQLIERFVAEANKHLNTPVRARDISVSFFGSFPTLSLLFEEVKIEGSDPEHPSVLLEAEALYLTLDLLKIARGNYTVEAVRLVNGYCFMTVSKKGTTNYKIFKTKEGAGSDSTIAFDLRSVMLDNIHYKYEDAAGNILVDLDSREAAATISFSDNKFDIGVTGDFMIREIAVKDQLLCSQKPVTLTTALTYDQRNKLMNISPSDLEIGESGFKIYGDYRFDDAGVIALYLEGKETTIATLLDLLPGKLSKYTKDYESNGEVYFDLSLKGTLGRNTGPRLAIDFGLKDATIRHIKSAMVLTETTAEGTFTAENGYDLSRSALALKGVRGKLEGREFKGDLTINDFSSPYLQFHFDGVADLIWLKKWYMGHGDGGEAEGAIAADLTFNGKITDLKSKAFTERISASGQLELLNVGFSIPPLKLPVKQMNGSFLFNNNHVAIEKVSGQYGASDFELNGFFKNLWAYLLLPNEPLDIEAGFEADFVDLDELLMAAGDGTKNEYKLTISPRLRLKLNSRIGKLTFRRFEPADIKGSIIVSDQKLYTPAISFAGMGGRVSLNGSVDASRVGVVATTAGIKTTGIYADSIFYVFENFDQDFLESRHLKGQVYADIMMQFETDSLLNLKQETLESRVSVSIAGGELNNFEPLQQLSKYVNGDKPDNLVVADLQSEIFIKDKTIYLPELDVKNNIHSFKISGTHDFDQTIDYKIVTPLSMREKIDKDEAFGAIEEDTGGRSMLYLKITGTTDNYKVSYDTDEVKKKIVADLKKEVKELKEAFKNKGMDQQKKVELEEDDYFDWGNE